MHRGDLGGVRGVGAPPAWSAQAGGAPWRTGLGCPAWGSLLSRRREGPDRGVRAGPAPGAGVGAPRRSGRGGRPWAPGLVLALLALLALARVAGMAASPARGPLAGTLIVVDPGHGGVDRGACHLPSNTVESEITLAFSFLLRDLLREQGARVLLTRTRDEDLDLDPRIEIANANRADYFLSIHVNWFPDPSCFGAQTFYFPGREESRRLALLVQDELKKVDPANFREIQTGRYRVLRLTRMPGVLVELGFVDSPHDRAFLHDPERRRQLAEAIVRGVIRHRRGEVGPEPAPDLRDR